MRNLPSEQTEKSILAISEFLSTGYLSIFEPCDCGSNIRHNNGGNYHEEIFLKKDSGKYFSQIGTTSEYASPQPWEELTLKEVFMVIEEHSDWL